MVCFITFFVNNGILVPDIMESRNIVTAREMVDDGHWLVPTMNGDLRLEKPPLPTWIIAVGEIVSPDNLSLQRGYSGVAAVFLILCFYSFAKRILNVPPLLPTLLLCTCYNIILAGRTATWDIFCHAFMMGAIYQLSLALLSPRCSWKRFMAAGILIGLSIMSKGPVSLYALLLPFLVGFIVCYRHQITMKGKAGALSVMILSAIVIGCWWYAYIFLYQSDAMTRVAGTESGSWLNHSVRPWYYYWKFFLETGIWSLLLLTAIFLPLTRKSMRRDKRFLFPFLWMAATLFLLSLLPEKKSRYLLPILLSACYVMGYLLNAWSVRFKMQRETKTDRILFRANTFLLAGIVFLLPAAVFFFVYKPGYASLPVMPATALVSWTVAYILFRAGRKLSPSQMVWCVTFLFLIIECLAFPLLKDIVNNREMKSVATTRSIKELQEIPFYYDQKEPLRIEMVYMAHRKIRPIDLSNAKDIQEKMPCAILTHHRIGEYAPEQLWENTDSTYIGLFDDNYRPKDSHWYKDDFIYHITLLKRKSQTR